MPEQESGFRMFDVYLGALRRKEDVFTYYLASCLDYCYLNHREVFADILRGLLHIEDLHPEFTLLTAWEAHEYFGKSFRDAHDIAEYFQGSRVFREFPLPVEGNLTCYLDLAFLLRPAPGAEPVFVGIEGKVFDRSVTPGQLSKYCKSITAILDSTRVPVKMFLLSTIHQTEQALPSRAALEVRESKLPVTSLILWEDFKEHFEQVSDSYFQSAWADARLQLDHNRKKDYEWANVATEAVEKYLFAQYLRDDAHVLALDDLLGRLAEAKVSVKGDKFWDVTLSKLGPDQTDELLGWILQLFECGVNLKPWDSRDARASAPHQPATPVQALAGGEVETLLDALAKTEGLPSWMVADVDSLSRKVDRYNKGDRLQRLLDQFQGSLETDAPAHRFYARLLGSEGLQDKETAQFHSDAKGSVTRLGLWIRLKVPVKNKPAAISLMTLECDRIRIPISK